MINPPEISKLWETVVSGGPIMIPLALLSFMLYRNALGLYSFISNVRIQEEFEHFAVTHDRETVIAFRDKLRDLLATQQKYANVLIVAAPLLGLLGTVIGMLDTFKGIGAESGLDTTQAVADGVKVALITTQTGLMIAIIGLFFTQLISRAYRKKELLLVELELKAMKKGLNS